MENDEITEVECHDCGKKIEVKEGEPVDGFQCNYQLESEKIMIFKCKDCYSKNKALTNFNKCEVYSRIVGYLRPVQHWNKGKQQEFDDRKPFKI